jgi:hypothetical protein
MRDAGITYGRKCAHIRASSAGRGDVFLTKNLYLFEKQALNEAE